MSSIDVQCVPGGWDCHDSCYSTTPAQAQFLPTDNMNLRPPPPPPPPPPSPPSPVVSKTTDGNESKESCHTGEKRKLPENEQYRGQCWPMYTVDNVWNSSMFSYLNFHSASFVIVVLIQIPFVNIFILKKH